MKRLPPLIVFALLSACGYAQAHTDFDPTPVPSPNTLPSNYKTILDNPDVLVMHVHYGAHESVPMHDHPAVATMYLYLNDSGEVDIIHEGPDAVTAHRPPTHTGAYRLAPGIAERHSIQSNSDTPSDFLRIEFKNVTFPRLPEAGKHFAAPAASAPGNSVEFQNDALTITRVICATQKPCDMPTPDQRALIVPLTPTAISRSGIEGPDLPAGQPRFLPASTDGPYSLRAASQALVLSFTQAPSNATSSCKF
jgi:hypothetical protein